MSVAKVLHLLQAKQAPLLAWAPPYDSRVMRSLSAIDCGEVAQEHTHPTLARTH